MWYYCIISELRTVWQISNPIPKELEAHDFSRVSVHEEFICTCKLTDRKPPNNESGYGIIDEDFPIPDWCPLLNN